MRRPSSEPWAFGGAWRPRVECRRGTSHGGRRGDGARLLRRGGHPLPDQDSDGGPDQRQDPCSDAEDDGNDHDQDPEKAPEEGEGCEQRREGDDDDDPADCEAEESAQESEPERFSHLLQEEPGEEPDDESANENPIRSESRADESQQPKYDSQHKADQPDDPKLHPCHLSPPGGGPGADCEEGQGYKSLASRLSDLGRNPTSERMALRRRRRALSSRLLLAALYPIVLEGMLDRQADSVWSRTNAVRLHRRTFRRGVLRRARRPRDVLDLILRHVRGKVWDVPEDAEDLLVAQADVMEECDDRETAHVRDVLVVLDLREQVVHARREPRDTDLPDVLRLERRLLRLQDPADLTEVRPECRDDVVVHGEGQAFLDVPLDRVSHDSKRLGPLQDDIPAVHSLVDQLPGRVAHRVREA